LASQGARRRKADETDPGQVGAPMPGMIVSLAVAAGDEVAAGDKLFTIEAMKMETAVYAKTAGKVTELVSTAGTRVEAHDLVVVMDCPEG
jgi:pyruvate carboxylase